MSRYLAVLVVGSALGTAHAAEVRDCAAANVDLRSLVTPVSKHSRTFYKGKVSVFEINQVEPACCAAGIAFVLPDSDSETGDLKCIAVTGLYRTNLGSARTSYDPAKGLLLLLPVTVNERGVDAAPLASTLHLRLNLKTSTVVIEKGGAATE